MFVEINGKYLNTHYVSSMKKSTEEIDGQTKYIVNFTLTNGANIKQVFDTQADADEKYEEVEKSGGGGSGPSTNVYVYRGSCLFDELPTTGNTAGDVYNIEDDFELGGKTYYAGTNVAWKGDDWDPLAGTIDTSIFETKSNKTTTIDANSTNEQYPSAAGVFDFINSMNLNYFEKIQSNSYASPFILENKKLGVYFISSNISTFCIQGRSSVNKKTSYSINNSTGMPFMFIYNKHISTVTGDSANLGITFYRSSTGNRVSLGNVCLWDGYIYMAADSGAPQISTHFDFLFNMAQTFDGKKTFTTIPEQSNTNAPTNNKQFTNKKYVDDQIIASAVQYTTMPTAAQTNLGKVIQFIGTTDSTYTNGYFYQCVSDGEQEPTYSWQRIDVQPAPDMSSYYTKTEVDALLASALGDIETVVDSILNGSANAENMEF